jgi:hypothetical protein
MLLQMSLLCVQMCLIVTMKNFLVVLFLLKRFMAFLLPACLMSYLTILGLMGYLIFLVEPLFLSYLTILVEPLFLMMLIFVFLLVGVTKIDALIFMAWAALAGGLPARPSPTPGCCAPLAMILSSALGPRLKFRNLLLPPLVATTSGSRSPRTRSDLVRLSTTRLAETGTTACPEAGG